MYMRLKWKWLSGSGLKILAVVSMLVDHLAAFVWKGDPFMMTHLLKIGHRWITPYFLARSFGRIAFPIFAFLIVEGFLHTRSRIKYGRNLVIFALISEIPWCLLHYGGPQLRGHNVFFTLLLGFLALCAIESFKEDKPKMAAALIGMLVFSVLFQADYGCMGYAFIPMLYLLRGNIVFQAIVGCGMLPSRWIGGSAFIPISMYNGKRGFIKGAVGKYFFYAFYPLHLLAIYLFKTFI